MVALADKKGVAPFLTALNGSQLKNRIIMMKKKTENKFAPLKQLVILPLLAILIMGLSNKEVKTEIIQTEKASIKFISDVQNDSISTEKGNKKKLIEQKSDTTMIRSSLIPNSIAINNSTEPLYIVDGKVTKSIIQVSPQDIESIDVLKDESATSLYGTKGKNGAILITTKSKSYEYLDENAENIRPVPQDEIRNPEVMPQFPGGETALKKYIDNSIVYPKRALEKGIIGTVYVEFVISKSGKVRDAKIARGVDPDLNKEALRVVNTLPLWKPGRKNGKPVDVTYTVPVEFDIKGFPHKIRSAAEGLSVPKPLYIVDGKEVEEITELDPNNIESISVLKDKSASDLYGKKGKNGVIIIQTKNYKKNSQNELPVVLNGKLTQLTLNEVDRDLIQSIKRIEPVDAVKKYGEKGENGVFEITSRNVYTDKVKVKSSEEFKNENITTPLELRKYIARNIKYPKEAVETNTDGTTSFLIRVDNNGNIFDIMKPGRADIGLETVVVTAEKTKKPGRYIKNKNQSLLTNEVKRVIEKTPRIQIPEFKEKTVQVSVKFVLQ
jgi:TonB family protein